MGSNHNFSQQQLMLAHIFMACGVAIGIFFRFWGLGTSPLSVDEYYFSKSVYNILEKGIPLHEAGGGLYLRGLLQQYLSAGLLSLNAPMEWSLRLIPALCSIICIPAVYLIGKRMGGPILACGATFIFGPSLREIEFARFARMYAPFQALFLWHTYFLIDATVRGQRNSLIVAYGLSWISVYVYEASPFLLVLNFLPLFSQHFRKFLPPAILALVGIALYIFHRKLGSYAGPPRLPADLADYPLASTRFGLLHPPLLITQSFGSGLWRWLFLIPASTSIYFLIQLLRQPQWLHLWSLFLCAAIVSALMNLFGLSAICFILGLAFLQQDNQPLPLNLKALLGIGGCLILSGLYWSGFGLTTEQWLGNVSNLDLEQHPQKLKQLISILINYPDTVTRFLKPWLVAIPITSLIMILGMAAAALVMVIRPNQTNDDSRYVFAIILAAIAFISAIDTIQKSTRYAFFFYPLMILLCCYGVFRIAQMAKPKMATGIFATFIITTLWAGEDFSAKHLLKINEPEIMYRTQYSLKRGNFFYPRRDFRSPGEFVNQHFQDGDTIVSEVTVVDLYLDHPIQYMYLPMEQNRFWTRAVLEGTRDQWTNAHLIYRLSDLEQHLSSIKQRTWFINFSTDWMGEPAHYFRELFPEKLKYTNQDDTIDVFLLEPNQAH